MRGWQFAPRRGFTLVVLIGVMILLSLGTWQVSRRQASLSFRQTIRRQLAEAPFDADHPPADPNWRQVEVRGRPDWDHVLLLEGQYMWYQPGVKLILPVETRGGEHLLVNLGWVPREDVEAIIARDRRDIGERTWVGLAKVIESPPGARGSFPEEQGYARRWRAISPGQMGEALGRSFAPWIVVDGVGIEGGADIPDRVPPISGWVREPESRPHGEYAFTWYSLACTLTVVWFSASVRRAESASTPILPAPKN